MKTGFFTLLCIFGLLAMNNANAQIYLATAADGGSSSNSGTSWNSPLDGSAYFTSKNNTALAPAGTTIYIKKGNYSYNGSIANSGTMIANSGISVIGGFPQSAQNNDISGYDPKNNPTVITIGNAGYLFFNNTGANTNFSIKGIEFSAASTTGVHVIRANGGNSTYTITDVYIHDMNGAALYLTTAGTITITNSIFNNNTWTVAGSAFYLNGSANATVTNSSFSGNLNNGTTTGGGAISGSSASSGSITIDHSYFCNNYAGGYGAAVHKEVGSLIIKNNTVFYNNSAGFNGTVSYKSGASVSNDGTTIFSTNSKGGIYYISGATNTGNNNTTTLTCPGYTQILPVTFTNFIATQQNNTVKLNWSTATETNNTGFAVERSTDGINFTKIGFTASEATNGNSNSALNYNYMDGSPLASTNYYRLKQVDFDGHSAYSNIATVLVDAVKSLGLNVYPNPVSANTQLIVSGITNFTNANISVTNNVGQVVSKQTILQAVTMVDFSKLASGVYYIKYSDANGNNQVVKVVK